MTAGATAAEASAAETATGRVTTVGAATTGTAAARVATARVATGRAATAGCFSNRSFTCRSFSSRNEISRSEMIRSDSNRTDRIGNDTAGAAARATGATATRVTAAGLTAAGATAAGVATAGMTGAGMTGAGATGTGTTATGATTAGAATGVFATGAVCGVTAFWGIGAVTLVADLTGCSATATEGVFVAGSDWICKSSGWFSDCSKAARAAAWAGLSAARTEMTLAPRTTHKPREILIFMKLAIFTRFCEHPRGQFSLYRLQMQGWFPPLCKRLPNRCLRCLGTSDHSALGKVHHLNPNLGECPNNVHGKKKAETKWGL